MLLFNLVFGLAIAAQTLAHGGPFVRREAENVTEVEGNTQIAPKRFIVEFEDGADINAAVELLGAKTGTKVLKVFDNAIFKGAAIEAVKHNLDSLRAVQPVFKAWNSRKIQLAPSVPLATFSQDATAMNYSIHHMTGVDKLHAEGVTGKGAVVAIVDTGVDYNHPALGGGFGPGFKIAGGYDLVGDGFYPESGIKEPDSDVMDQAGHGTHVSGIVAGKDASFTGVAPDATILMYKVFSQSGSTEEDTLIDAFLMAFDAGADIVTSSIGGLSGWVDGAWALVGSRLVDQGVVVTISAGNDGNVGAFGASSGSSGANVLAIASVEADVLASASFLATFNLGTTSNTTYIAYRSTNEGAWAPSKVKGWPIKPLTLDTAILDDACTPISGNASLANTVVLVRRGGCNFSVKQANVGAVGATHLLVYNNDSPLVIPTPGEDISLPILSMITAEAGAAIIANIKAGGNVTADFSLSPMKNLVGVPNELDGGVASYFTSVGPTNELFIKPDIAAPGGQIYSTYLGGWAILSGTSMACPYVAGVAALYISKHGGRATHGPKLAKDLAMRIISSGEAVKWDDGQQQGNEYDFYASVAQLGTGLLNATKILDYTTQLSFSKFALNDTHHFSRYHSVDITNGGPQAITYTFELQDFGGLDAYITDPEVWGTPRVSWLEDFIFNPQKMVPSVTFPSDAFVVKPGETRTAKINFMYPEGLDASKLPVYSGKILVKGSNSEVMGIPYMGLGADLAKGLGHVMFQYPIGFPSLVSTPDMIPISAKSNFTFDLSLDKQDFPNIYTRANYATTELRFDIFEGSWKERDWKYPPIVGQAGYIGSATNWAGAQGANVFDPALDDATDLITFPMSDVPRDVTGAYGTWVWWLGTLSNGTQIPPGKYQMRFAALVPFGEPTHADNWDVVPTFNSFEVLKK